MSVVTEKDKRKLLGILALLHNEKHEDLRKKLEAAQIILDNEISPDVITMNTLFLFQMDIGDETKTGKLVYHFDAEQSKENISIFSPLGISLLGMVVGKEQSFLLNEKSVRIKIIKIICRPQQ